MNIQNTKLDIRDVCEMPEGVGLETRLHPKRRRYWEPRSEHTSRASQLPALVKVEPVWDEAPGPSRDISLPPASALSHAASSPADYMELSIREGVAGRLLPRRRLADEETEDINYGSDDSDNGDENEALPPVSVSRMAQILQETPFDEEQDDMPQEMPMFVELPLPAGMEHLLDLLDDPPTLPPPADVEETLLPRDLYQFDWQAFPEVPCDPSARRERFSVENVGPTCSLTDPYDIFIAMWDRDIMELIAEETNRYAQQKVDSMLDQGILKPNSRICQWKDTNVDELYVFFAVLIAMGSVVKNCIEDYWSTAAGILSTPGFAAYMSYNRYQLLMSCLHFRNNDDMHAAELGYSEAKLFKIDPILNHLNYVFQDLYTPGQNLSLDESLLLWKGRLEINVLIPNKAARVGIKSFEVCESQTGYLWRFEIHAQQKGSVQRLGDILKSSTPAIVLRLIDGLENKGYTLWMDNYYNSPALARHLKSKGFDCVGTLRTNRMFVPQDLHSLTKAQMRPGQLTGLTSGDVDVMVWRDANRVAVISTYHGNAVVRGLESTVPILIHDYNIAMGGVDKKDQMLASYPVERKRGRAWYKKLFKRLLNVSIHNSYIIHKHNTHITNTKTLDPKIFREKLINSLLAKHKHDPQHRPFSLQSPAPAHDTVPRHRLSQYPVVGDRHQRRLCTVCKKRVVTFCVGCDKAMCIAGDCFVIGHTPS